MRQICSLAYFTLIKEKSPAEIAELDVLLSDPKDKEEMIDRQNAEAMKALQGMGPAGFIPPPRKKKPQP